MAPFNAHASWVKLPDARLRACLFAACAVVGASGSACKASSLLQVKATRSQVSSTDSPMEADCPADGQQCTLIAVEQEGAHILEMMPPRIARFANVSQLQAIGQAVLDFGKHHPHECCEAYKALKSLIGVESVEFDAVVRGSSMAMGGHGGGHVGGHGHGHGNGFGLFHGHGNGSEQEWGLPHCPADGKQCTLMVVENDGVNILEEIMQAFNQSGASITHLSSIGQITLDFGKHRASACCAAYEKLLKESGVKAVEFDSPFDAVDEDETKSIASTVALWPTLPWILGFVLNAF